MNAAGYEAGNESVSTGRDLPWLQDTPEQNVWSTWAPTYRDVVIVDQEGRQIGSYNLTSYPLSDTINYDDLLNLLVEEAEKTRPIEVTPPGPE